MFRCPECDQELVQIGFTEYGALELDASGKWSRIKRDLDFCEYHCLECSHQFNLEELEELGLAEEDQE